MARSKSLKKRGVFGTPLFSLFTFFLATAPHLHLFLYGIEKSLRIYVLNRKSA